MIRVKIPVEIMAEKDAENLVWQEDAMIVSNGPKDMSKEMLIAFLEENGNLEILHVFPGRKPGTFLVYCENDIDFEDVQRMCQKKCLKGNQLKVERIKEINSVEVKNVSSNVSSDSLRRYFGNSKRSSGGDISSVQQQTSDTYIVSFKEAYGHTGVNGLTSVVGNIGGGGVGGGGGGGGVIVRRFFAKVKGTDNINAWLTTSPWVS
ncbi:protein mono-ADP-ribosyltransferase PARP14-like [Octopus vulgaris]|uniref:Protein mono-ADP-ribosyltransferase PARP14-like n=1 Tax=Octopus vulgaris TaxID=6645 RepID=A0AA36AKL4_OCTVU|nr:protein mono-ADP-ribosyltransferase PARP14-like [Octopus vulgaris]